MSDFLITAFVTFMLAFPVMAIVIALVGLVVPLVVVGERQCLVFTLFGKVIGRIDQPGLHFLPAVVGVPNAWLVKLLGTTQVVDLRLDQQYLRSLPVNSEEGAPMGIGVWYEMYVSDPESYLFRNTDPRGSLQANVSNATVRCLSNLKLDDMLENRHEMSRTVRGEVSPHSHEWGFRLGSVYIRKVHFRDRAMIRQIEEKVVNRLRQVTAAILQDGTNQVNLISSSAERRAAVEFARASAIRPEVVGEALRRISEDPEVADALFQVLETGKMLEGEAAITLIPPGTREDMMVQLAVQGEVPSAPPEALAEPAPEAQPGSRARGRRPAPEADHGVFG